MNRIFLDSLVATGQWNTWFFFGSIKQLSSQSGPKGCVWNFLRLPNIDFDSCSAVCSLLQRLTDYSWYLALALSVGIKSKSLTVLEIWQFKVRERKSPQKFGFKKWRELGFWSNCDTLCPLRWRISKFFYHNLFSLTFHFIVPNF